MNFSQIKSKDNLKIKKLKKLKQKKYRQKYNEFLIENFKIILDAYLSGNYPKEIYFTNVFYDKNKEVANNILKKIKKENIYIFDTKINKVFSNLDAPSGVVAVYDMKESKINFNKPIIYLNGINDPGNLGTIIRSASSFGLKNIILDEKCVDIYNFKTLTAAKDSVFKINIVSDENLKLLKSISKKTKIVSSVVKDGDDIKTIKKLKNYCLVIGSESHGVEGEILKISDKKATIKTKNIIESLNVASAASIIFYEITK